MSRITYEEAVHLRVGEKLRIIDGEPYRLVFQVVYSDKVELGWEHVIITFTNITMLKFPGKLNYFKLRDILETEQLPKNPRVKEVVWKSICICGDPECRKYKIYEIYGEFKDKRDLNET